MSRPTRSTIRDALRPTPLGAAGLLATALAFVALGGGRGVLAGGALVLLGSFLPAPAAYALGQGLALAALPSPGILPLAVVQSLLLVVLVGPATADHATGRLVGLTALLTGVLATGVWTATQTRDLLPVGAALVGGVAFVAYAFHRYERVRLGLAGGEGGEPA
ncbi:hypothetical protein [Natronomonas sp. EA1]|uniref:hypothetical protein n=1 Tax=Natronomonas sp. EA1 TaxID=3421655 RepID=UPI003EC054DB